MPTRLASTAWSCRCWALLLIHHHRWLAVWIHGLWILKHCKHRCWTTGRWRGHWKGAELSAGGPVTPPACHGHFLACRSLQKSLRKQPAFARARLRECRVLRPKDPVATAALQVNFLCTLCQLRNLALSSAAS